jgi:ATP-dependent protease HslVU (ClpYQ) peptidase subunit
MTCIVGIVDKHKNKVFIGGDSAGSSGNNVFIRKDAKVFKNGDFVFGCTTSFRMIQILRFSFQPPVITYDKDIYEYMCTHFINAVREAFRNGGYLQKETTGLELGGTFLVAYKYRLFKIENDLQVAEHINGIDACGCGQDFALGAIVSLKKSGITTEQKVLKALSAAEFLSVGVCRPFIIIGT